MTLINTSLFCKSLNSYSSYTLAGVYWWTKKTRSNFCINYHLFCHNETCKDMLIYMIPQYNVSTKLSCRVWAFYIAISLGCTSSGFAINMKY